MGARTELKGDDPSEVMSVLLANSNFADLKIPLERRSWLVGVLETALSQELVRADLGDDEDRASRMRGWSARIPRMLDGGVIADFVDAIAMARDPDGKEVDRGWAWHAAEELELYDAESVRVLLEDAVSANDPDLWTRHANWFLRASEIPRRWRHVRAAAARWLPAFTPLNTVDKTLLDDVDPAVRRFTAMNLALYQPGDADPRAVKELVAALGDRDWIWSSNDYFNYFWAGRHSAGELLLRLDTQGPEVRGVVLDLLRQERQALLSLRQAEDEPRVSSIILRLEKALAR